MTSIFFVYGTLKSNHWNNDVLGDSKFLGNAITKDKFLLTTVGFPYLIPENAHTAAVGHPTLPTLGEMYQVCSEEVEASLDALEGVEYGHYKRQTIEVKCLDTGIILPALTYIPCDLEEVVKFNLCGVCEINGTKAYIY